MQILNNVEFIIGLVGKSLRVVDTRYRQTYKYVCESKVVTVTAVEFTAFFLAVRYMYMSIVSITTVIVYTVFYMA